jgi:hypothetical protein
MNYHSLFLIAHTLSEGNQTNAEEVFFLAKSLNRYSNLEKLTVKFPCYFATLKDIPTYQPHSRHFPLFSSPASHVQGSRISAEGAGALAECLKQNTSLRQLHLFSTSK